MPAQRRFRRATDLKIPLGRGHDLRVVDRPALRLDAHDLEALLADLRAVADRCVPSGTLRYGVLSGDRERLERGVVAVVREHATGRPVGFNAMSWLDVDCEGGPVRVLHAGLCMIVPGARRRGLLGLLSSAPALLAFTRNGFAPLWVTNVTQVPAVAGTFAAAAGDVFPAPGRCAPPSDVHRRIAAAVMAGHRHVFGVGADAEFDADRFVIRNAYTGGSDGLKKTWQQVGKHRDDRINGLCRGLLDYERGDDLLQVGRLDLRVMARLLAHVSMRLARRARRRLRSLPGSPTRLGPQGASVR